MITSAPRTVTYTSRLTLDELRAKAREFIQRQGGPLHPMAYAAHWLAPDELVIEPRITIGIQIQGQTAASEPALVRFSAAAGSVVVVELVLPANTSYRQFSLVCGVLTGGFALAEAWQGLWWQAGAAVLAGLIGVGLTETIGFYSSAQLQRDLERSFQLREV